MPGFFNNGIALYDASHCGKKPNRQTLHGGVSLERPNKVLHRRKCNYHDEPMLPSE